MKIKEIYEIYLDKYPNKLKIIKKWIFWILLEEEAFFMSKFFNLKLTSLDKNTIKVWFPDSSKNKWLEVFNKNNIWYVLFDKNDVEFISEWWFCYSNIFKINLEDFLFTKDRILWLKKLDLEVNNEKNFLLQIKMEELYSLSLEFLIRLPKKQRYYFREKIEKIFIETLEFIYKYKYNLWDRKEIIEKIFSNSIILREFFRLLYNLRIILNDNIYIDIWDRFLEILKICKSIKQKN